MSSRSFSKWLDCVIPLLAVMTLCFIVFRQAQVTTESLTWPYDYDAFRDIGVAQSILDGRYPEDHIYKGETLWYNPLAGAIVAGVSWITGLPPHASDVKIGPYVNLLIPLSLFALTWVLFDSWSAMVAVAFSLFCMHSDVWAWATPAYSPWLFAPSLTLVFFNLLLIALLVALARQRVSWYILVGILLGITFLGHVAPAVIGGCIILMTMAGDWIFTVEPGKRRKVLAKVVVSFLVSMVVAFLISLPFSYSILFHYKLHIANYTASWAWDYTSLKELPVLLSRQIRVSTVVMLIGFFAIMAFPWRSREKRIVLIWLLCAGSFFVYSYLAQAAAKNNVTLRQICPNYHFLLYLAALRNVLVGYGTVFLCKTIVNGIAKSYEKRWPGSVTSATIVVERTVIIVAVSIMLAVLMPKYGNWIEIHARDIALGIQAGDEAQMHDWILANTKPDDVFWYDERTDMIAIGPAGRKVIVASSGNFSNIYVEFMPRFRAHSAMYKAMLEGNEPAFREVANAYGVTYVLAKAELGQKLDSLALTYLRKVHALPSLTLYQVVPVPPQS